MRYAYPADVGRRVAVTTDLTRYHPSLTEGAEGTVVRAEDNPGTNPNQGWSARNPRFVAVDFGPPAGVWDMLRHGLRWLDGNPVDWEGKGQYIPQGPSRAVGQ